MPLDRWSKPTNRRDDTVINTLSSGSISIMVSNVWWFDDVSESG